MSIIKNTAHVQETPHPFLKGISMRTLYSKKADEADVTCFLVKCGVGSEIQEHIHEKEVDIIYVLQGKATMWIQDRGDFQLEPGVFVAVAKGMKHRTYNVTEELVIYDVFTPHMF